MGDFQEQKMKKKNNLNIYLVLGVILLVGYFFYSSSAKNDNKKVVCEVSVHNPYAQPHRARRNSGLSFFLSSICPCRNSQS